MALRACFFWGSLLCVLCNTGRQGINRLKSSRKPSPWPLQHWESSQPAARNPATGTESTFLCVFLAALCLGTIPWSDPAHRHTQWIERSSRCSGAAFPAEPHGVDTTAGSAQLPWKLGGKNTTRLLSWVTCNSSFPPPSMEQNLSFSAKSF